MEVTSTTRGVRMSPKKVREVTRQIQGLPATEAAAVLAAIPRKSARLVAQTLKSAVANAESINADWNEGEIQSTVAELRQEIESKTDESGKLARKARHLKEASASMFWWWAVSCRGVHTVRIQPFIKFRPKRTDYYVNDMSRIISR